MHQESRAFLCKEILEDFLCIMLKDRRSLAHRRSFASASESLKNSLELQSNSMYGKSIAFSNISRSDLLVFYSNYSIVLFTI